MQARCAAHHCSVSVFSQAEAERDLHVAVHRSLFMALHLTLRPALFIAWYLTLRLILHHDLTGCLV